MTNKSDILIVGGGPSGLSLARSLAAEGLDVRVLERKSGIGESVVCTGIVGKKVFEEFGLKSDSIVGEIREVRLVSPGGRSLPYRHSHSFASVVERYRFDRSLAEQAEDAGVRIALETKVLDIAPGGDRVRVVAKDRERGTVEYQARLAVIATGIHNGLQKKLGLGSAREYLYGVQMEVETDLAGATSIYFGKDVAPGGFAWVVPSAPGRARVGLVTSADAKTRFARLLEILNWPGFDASDHEPKYKAIAQGLVSRTFGDRVLVLGEAAGQVKTTTGGGIYFGLLCSRIAADAIRRALARGDYSTAGLASYEVEWRKLLRREIRIGEAARKILAGLSDGRLERLFDLARNDGMIPIVREKGNFDWHSDLILSLVKRLPLSLLGQWFRRRPESLEVN